MEDFLYKGKLCIFVEKKTCRYIYCIYLFIFHLLDKLEQQDACKLLQNISNMLGAFRGDRELHKFYDKDLFLENKIENLFTTVYMRKDLSYACKAKNY